MAVTPSEARRGGERARRGEGEAGGGEANLRQARARRAEQALNAIVLM